MIPVCLIRHDLLRSVGAPPIPYGNQDLLSGSSITYCDAGGDEGICSCGATDCLSLHRMGIPTSRSRLVFVTKGTSDGRSAALGLSDDLEASRKWENLEQLASSGGR